MQGDRSTDNDRLCVRGPNGTESVDKGNGEWKVRMQFSVSISRSLGLNSQVAILTLGSPCVAVFISYAELCCSTLLACTVDPICFTQNFV